MRPEHALVAEWLRKARRDLFMARLASENGMEVPDAWGFHCQQAVEKALKAFLQFHERDILRTHDLGFCWRSVKGLSRCSVRGSRWRRR